MSDGCLNDISRFGGRRAFKNGLSRSGGRATRAPGTTASEVRNQRHFGRTVCPTRRSHSGHLLFRASKATCPDQIKVKKRPQGGVPPARNISIQTIRHRHLMLACRIRKETSDCWRSIEDSIAIQVPANHEPSGSDKPQPLVPV